LDAILFTRGLIIGAIVNAANKATGNANNHELKYLSKKPSPIPVFTAVTTPHIITLMPNDIKIMNRV
tara:strand:- start:336 stop:536 length:201 start_codon:yes stop_codon:yes gene_type:complete